MRPLAVLFLALVPIAARAEPPHPLRFVPQEANLVVRVEHPRLVVETVTGLDLVRQTQSLPFVREQLQAPGFERFLQLLAYAEKELGAKWPELLDRLAGNGLTLATKAGGNNAPVVLVLDGTDEALAEKFLMLAVNLFEQELARQESKEKVEKATYRGIDGYKIGDFRIARVGAALVVSNNKDTLKAALGLNAGQGKSLADAPGPRDARKALPAECLAWLWLNLDVARNAPNAKAMFELPSNDPVQTFAIGGWLNVVKRSPFLAAGLVRDNDAFRLTLRFPGGGHDGMPEALALHVPPLGKPGGMGLLEPKGVIFSHNFYFDPDVLYQKRSLIFNEKIAKDFEDAEKNAKRFLLGHSLATLYAQAGPWHRVVVAHREPTGYGTKPKQYYPAIAYVNTMRDPALAKPMEGILRGIALAVGSQFKAKVFEETRGAVKIVGYRFPEDVHVPDDAEGLRFNFTPCFAAVKNQFLMCSTIEFCREMIDLLQREFESSQSNAHTSPFRSKFYGTGAAELVRGFEEQILGQIILDQAVKPGEGRQQMEALMAWLHRLGTLELRSEYLEKEFRFDVEWRRKKD
jgi:hypothetical protein